MPTKKLAFEFNRDKAIEAIIYVANRVTNPGFLRISKLLYFADKTSLEQYGRFISGDIYVAMRYGPVPSNSYDLMKEAPLSGEWGFRTERDRNVSPCREPNLDEFSDSDIECLDLAIEIWGRIPIWKLIEESHDKAWDDAWANRGDRMSIDIPIESIIELLEDSDELNEYLRTRHTD